MVQRERRNRLFRPSPGHRGARKGRPRRCQTGSDPDAEGYLQGQTSQDIAALAPGGSAWALVLQPQGKLDVFVRVSKVALDEFLLDADAGMGAALVARLSRFKLRTKVEIEPLAWRVVAVRGPGASRGPATPGTGAAVAARFEWGGLSGYDLLGRIRPFATCQKRSHWNRGGGGARQAALSGVRFSSSWARARRPDLHPCPEASVWSRRP